MYTFCTLSTILKKKFCKGTNFLANMQGKEQKVLPEIMFCSITSKKTAPLVRYCH